MTSMNTKLVQDSFRVAVNVFGLMAAIALPKPAFADRFEAPCTCSSPSCSLPSYVTVTVDREDMLAGACASRSGGQGKLGPVKRIPESRADMSCNGNPPPAKPTYKGPVVVVGGLVPGRACVTVPPSKRATTLYCQMYDSPTEYNCDMTPATNGNCPFTATREVVMSDATNGRTYCWTWNNEDVGRKRSFFLSADVR